MGFQSRLFHFKHHTFKIMQQRVNTFDLLLCRELNNALSDRCFAKGDWTASYVAYSQKKMCSSNEENYLLMPSSSATPACVAMPPRLLFLNIVLFLKVASFNVHCLYKKYWP
jgi:hypothetical protein